MQVYSDALLAGPAPAAGPTPVNLAALDAAQLTRLLVAPPAQLLMDCGAQLLPHPLGVCRFAAQLLQLHLRGGRIWLCNVHPGLRRYLHQLKLGALFHLTGQETPPWAAAGSPACAPLT